MGEDKTVHVDAPVTGEADVVVAGAGIAGVFAAVTAAREGADTVLVDRLAVPGGNWGPGLGVRHDLWQHPFLWKKGLGGVAGEFIDRLGALGGMQRFPFTGGGDSKDWSWEGMPELHAIRTEEFVYLAYQMLEEAGVRLLLDSPVTDVVMEGDRVTGVVAATRRGCETLGAKVVIDTTGEAAVAVMAGAPCEMSTSRNAGLMWTACDVDWQRYESYRKENKRRPLTPDDEKWMDEVFFARLGWRWRNWPRFIYPQIREAWESGEFEYVQKVIGGLRVYMLPFGIHGKDITETRGHSVDPEDVFDPTDSWMMSVVESKYRRYTWEVMRFHRRHVPGFENARIKEMGALLGSSYTRSMVAEHVLSESDIWDGAAFDDVVHALTSLKRRDGSTLIDMEHGEEGAPHELPYRQLLPRGVEGLLGAGKTINCNPKSRLRARWITMLTGCISGTAAAMASTADATPRGIDVKALQRTLHATGFWLGDEARLKTLGLP